MTPHSSNGTHPEVKPVPALAGDFGPLQDAVKPAPLPATARRPEEDAGREAMHPETGDDRDFDDFVLRMWNRRKSREAGARFQARNEEEPAPARNTDVSPSVPETRAQPPTPEDVDNSSEFAHSEFDGNIIPPSTNPRNILRIAQKEIPEPEIDHGVIAQLAAAGARDGLERVVQYHRDCITELAGAQRRVLQEAEQHRSKLHKMHERHVRSLARKLKGTDHFIVVNGDKAVAVPQPDENSPCAPATANEPLPWTNGEILEVVIGSILAVSAIGMSLFMGANFLRSSGLPAFSTWNKSLLVCGTTLLGIWGVKCFSRLIDGEANRRIYGWIILLAGFAGWLVWLACMGQTFQNATADLNIAALADLHTNSAGAGTADAGKPSWLFFMVAIFTDAMLAGGIWVTIAAICALHRRYLKVVNPSWKNIRRELDSAHRLHHDEAELLGIIRARLEKLSGMEARFLGRARAIYEATVAHISVMQNLLRGK